MSMGALSFVMLVWRAMSSTSVRRSTLVPLCMMGTSQNGPRALHALEVAPPETGHLLVVLQEVDYTHCASPLA